MNDKYILNGKVPVKTESVDEWARMFESEDRRVALDKVGESSISTVFLGLDHNWGEGPPILFETMVFGGALDGEQERYHTWEEAEKGHREMVERVKES